MNNTQVIEINVTNITHDIAASFVRDVRPVIDALRVRTDERMDGWTAVLMDLMTDNF